MEAYLSRRRKQPNKIKSVVNRDVARSVKAASGASGGIQLPSLSNIRKTILRVQQELRGSLIDVEETRYGTNVVQNGYNAVPRIVRAQKLLNEAIKLQEDVDILVESAQRELRGENTSEDSSSKFFQRLSR